MALDRVLAVDLAKVYSAPTGGTLLRTLAWGDRVRVEEITEDHVEIRLTWFQELDDGSIEPQHSSGFIRPTKSSGLSTDELVTTPGQSRVLRVDFVDVQQGDAAVLETPGGRTVLIDGGDNQLFARYLASRYRGTRDDRPKEVDAIVVTHGDADHFEGLCRVHESEGHPRAFKRLFIHPRRVFHNGLVKRPGKIGGVTVKAADMFGATATIDGRLVVTELVDDPTTVAEEQMNEPFRKWKTALESWRRHGPIELERLEKGDDDAFDFLDDEEVEVEVLGPIPTEGEGKRGLAFLGNPPRGPKIGHESLDTDEFTGKSAAHTINGHSVILRVRYGDFHFLFAGDLNDQAERILTRAHNLGELNLKAEVLKVPHHGSADFSSAFLEAVSPVVSVVSSGDENAAKEYIHPRATLMGALGRASRVPEPLIFVTEMVAFFRVEGWVDPEMHKMQGGKAVVVDGEAEVKSSAKPSFFAFSRTAIGIVLVRTDGHRLLVFTNSGRTDLREAYAYEMDENGLPRPVAVRAT
jgi:beta-lactamase superfamily II metal-dependent hydrolase